MKSRLKFLKKQNKQKKWSSHQATQAIRIARKIGN